jgi:hypothetical protein
MRIRAPGGAMASIRSPPRDLPNLERRMPDLPPPVAQPPSAAALAALLRLVAGAPPASPPLPADPHVDDTVDARTE